METVIKGWFTTILGCIAMGWALYGYVWEGWEWQEAAGLGGVGFCLLFIRDKVSVWIEEFKTAVLAKFGLNKTKDDK